MTWQGRHDVRVETVPDPIHLPQQGGAAGWPIRCRWRRHPAPLRCSSTRRTVR
ncbi:hypothetical protein JK364_04085 [Streptomyces sp. 110]|uniref:Uncharacterized protein n=1 Tax=Streptomyces endocoffeicus TaxID=2898945 RepID=A0ABS1PIH8_9ACTN|nr:hypothetical protein [Streptomyces endocoffeicus]